ncbi:MAG: NAD(+)/NADH kinase [Candidatus Bipolaricaulia bacterium]
MIEKLLVLANFAKEGVEEVLAEVRRWGEEHGIAVEVHEAFGEERLVAGPGTVALTLGGDGTFLRALERLQAQGVPLLGINLGSLGFLTQSGSDELPQVLEKLRKGEFTLERRMMLQAVLAERSFLALNDLVVAHRTVEEFSILELYADGELVASYPGDGLIVSTPTGSTAYALAAGGPLIDPRLESLLVVPLTVHKLGIRPVLFPSATELRLVARTPATVLVDGDAVGELETGAELRIRRASQRARIVLIEPRHSLFALLERKLNWGRNSPHRG